MDYGLYKRIAQVEAYSSNESRVANRIVKKTIRRVANRIVKKISRDGI